MKAKHLALIIAVVAVEILEISFCLGETIPFADFEQKDWGKWKVEGTAFGSDPCSFQVDPANNDPNQVQRLKNFIGKGLANSYNNKQGDLGTGIMTSPEFKIEKPFITYLIGGGYDLDRLCINLVIGDKMVRTDTGHNSDWMRKSEWDVRDLIGETAHIEIVDDNKVLWGHIEVDEIQFNDKGSFSDTSALPGVFADFEGSYTWQKWISAGWEVEGSAFGSGPTAGDIQSQQKLKGYEGEAIANSYALGIDIMVGKLTSPPFKIEKPVITFLLGGGNDPDKIGIRLLIDGDAVLTSAGKNSVSRKHEKWNVSEFMGKTAVIEIFDSSADVLGFIIVDHIQFGD